MNCKPGDLALIVSGPDRVIGALVRVLELAPVGREAVAPDGEIHAASKHERPRWLVEVLGSRVKCFRLNGMPVWHRYIVAPDSVLRPIGNPGDDAVDESSAWLPPVPLPKIEPALLPAKEDACS